MRTSRTLEPDDRISRYRVLGSIGNGGMGEVYLARDERLRRVVALKILPPHLTQNEERVHRFIREARSASALSHPNIVAIHEIGFDRVRAPSHPPSEPIHFIAMELVEGETLARKIHDTKNDLRTLLGWLAQAAEGIAKAHAAGVVHRDLKPGNIMVSNDGYAKVLDFGLAKLTEREHLTSHLNDAPTESFGTSEGAVIGTPGYMSPEQVLGKAVDARSDVFSMGCVLYEAATRRLPFVGDTPIDVMHRILRDPPAPVEEIAPEVPPEVRRIIRRCLAKSPDQRFQSMKDLAIDLHEVHDDYGGAGVPSAKRSALSFSPGRVGASASLRRRIAIGIAAVLMLAALAAVLRPREVDEAAARGTLMPPDSKIVLDPSVVAPQLPQFTDGQTSWTAWSPDGKSIAVVRQIGQRERLWVLRPGKGEPRLLAEFQAGTITKLAWTPDSKNLLFTHGASGQDVVLISDRP